RGTNSSFRRVRELVRRIVTMSSAFFTRLPARDLCIRSGNDEAPARPLGQRVMQQMRMLRNVVMAQAVAQAPPPMQAFARAPFPAASVPPAAELAAVVRPNPQPAGDRLRDMADDHRLLGHAPAARLAHPC